jgi:hypothetical protein
MTFEEILGRFCRNSARMASSHRRVACVCRSACGVIQGSCSPTAQYHRGNSLAKAASLSDSPARGSARRALPYEPWAAVFTSPTRGTF